MDQEERVRRTLVAEGFTQPYGASDEEIRRKLRLKGPCADFVGYNPQSGRWLIAESKGGNLEAAERQLRNTVRALLKQEPAAKGEVDLQIHVDARNYQRLHEDPLLSAALGGYYLREGDDYLGNYLKHNEHFIWTYSEVEEEEGTRILVVRADVPVGE